MQDKILRLHGKVQHYAWGGFTYIPELLGEAPGPGKPCAEYWMGAHPSASSDVDLATGTQPLLTLIKENPGTYIGADVYKKFGELPFLFKILDVKEMLSIQVHPSRSEAIKGFEAEEAAGVPLHAPQRNYKDKNHKPEVMVALSEFWLLHGFRAEDELREVLSDIPEFRHLLPVFEKDGYFGLYRQVMELSQEAVDELLAPLVQRELGKEVAKSEPGYWVKKLFPPGTEIKAVDRGIFSIYFFNIVRVEPGQAVFQGAGIPHAYLEGQNAELMANSDNVLRGGLTPKYVDVPELLKHTNFEAVIPLVMNGTILNEAEKNYPCPVEDFAISAIRVAAGQTYEQTSRSPEIYIVIEGEISIEGAGNYKKGECFYVIPGTRFLIEAQTKCLLYKAFLPFV